MALLIIGGAAAILLLLALILIARLHPFLALILVATGVAVAAGVPVTELANAIEGGLGKTLGHVAVIIALGAMIGRLIELSGGAQVLANRLIERFGDKRVPLAMVCTAFGVGIPVFFEVGVMMLMPLLYGLARTRGMALVVIGLPVCAVLLVVHALLPPHPGMVAVAGELGIDIGRLLLLGLPVALATGAATVLAASRLTRRPYSMTADIVVDEAAELGQATRSRPHDPQHHHEPARLGSGAPPRAGLVAGLIALPIVLILAGTVAQILLPAGAIGRSALMFLGIPYVALLLGLLLCAYLLGIRRGARLATVSEVAGAAIPAVSVVILITGAGGAFAKVLVSTGIGPALATSLQSSGLPLAILAFLLAMLLRAAQGPTTVALMTTAGILAPLVAQASPSANQLALLGLAMGAGGMAVSHVNDAGFWIVTRMLGLNVADGLKSWTVLTTIAGITALGLILVLWQFV
ncbi:Inner membrane permease YgbN [Cupriavidus taiwanensis]|uniref:Inner membrane permease YgbN n=1 Tax=Cupriavidus taiwanensis TaxID=164546 RepID=A0A375BP33_9BURK|nr:gluconate:H+ symporter [Cupriavidus taiwanensis]SOY49258.1 Inner membrane permease YgbN [Cupriavidus taiwanensis]